MRPHGAGGTIVLRNGRISAKAQAFAYFDTGKDGTDLSLAALFGCQPKTVKRYRQAWRTRQRRRMRPPAKQHHGNPAPYRALTCAVLMRAVRDYRLGKPCGEDCRQGQYHRCASDAALFLQSPAAGLLFDVVGMSQAKVLHKLGLEVDDD